MLYGRILCRLKWKVYSHIWYLMKPSLSFSWEKKSLQLKQGKYKVSQLLSWCYAIRNNMSAKMVGEKQKKKKNLFPISNHKKEYKGIFHRLNPGLASLSV